jgi:hypothetical protein
LWIEVREFQLLLCSSFAAQREAGSAQNGCQAFLELAFKQIGQIIEQGVLSSYLLLDAFYRDLS